MPSALYRYDSGVWRSLWGDAPDIELGRDGLISGEDKPTPHTVGPAISTFEEMGTGGNISLSAGTYEGIKFWGTPIVAGSGSYTFKNCVFAGPNPTGSGIACIGFHSTYDGSLEVIDSKIDPGLWIEEKGALKLSPLVNGILGRQYTVRRTEITNTVDALGINGNDITIEQNWLHKGYFTDVNSGQSDGRTHNDGIQFHSGKDILIRGNVIGGTRVMTGYQQAYGTCYNAGDDWDNAALFIKQEVSNNEVDKIERVLINKNWIYGGISGINHSYTAARPNLFDTMTISENRFGQRSAGWAAVRKQNGTLGSGNGWYILRSAMFNTTYSDNIIEETGAPVTISNG